ncbi:hypothetical protein H072_2837 [Dactylellina haptotyla CBS 200.50]|uniref:Zn(2)-C6 fungal-type domain-containing protein n=1 Tax=Dactylellina haptotyla (strain CBS 200.50) TaxID=1284197 RepID=S8AQ03_DACHA|nr:hypothetical protein H072_2837 [Dactylellina haptotyla CBS 200.50]
MFPHGDRHPYPSGYSNSSSSSLRAGLAIQLPFYRVPKSQSRDDVGRHDSLGGPGGPRKRVNVACGRCRKRKIRCSGDPGNGSCCQNCKAAGVAPGLCQFLRVQCQEMQFNEHQPQDLQQLYERYDPTCMDSVASTYAGAGCISAPPVMSNGSHFETQLAGAVMPAPHSLQASRSLPTIGRRASPSRQQTTSHAPEEAGIALLASSAAAIASNDSFSKLPTADMNSVPSCGPPTYGLSQHWTNHAVEDIILRTVAESTPLRPTSSEVDNQEAHREYSVSDDMGDHSTLYFDGFIPQAATPPNVVAFLPTSSVREDPYGYAQLGGIQDGVNNIALTIGSKGQAPQPPPPPVSSQNSTGESSANVHNAILYPVSRPGNGSSHYTPFTRLGPQTSPTDAYTMTHAPASRKKPGFFIPPSLFATIDDKGIAQPATVANKNLAYSSSPLPSTFALTSFKKNTQKASVPASPEDSPMRRTSTVYQIDKSIPDDTRPGSRQITGPTVVAHTNTRPSSAGCGSGLASPRFGFDHMPHELARISTVAGSR